MSFNPHGTSLRALQASTSTIYNTSSSNNSKRRIPQDKQQQQHPHQQQPIITTLAPSSHNPSKINSYFGKLPKGVSHVPPGMHVADVSQPVACLKVDGNGVRIPSMQGRGVRVKNNIAAGEAASSGSCDPGMELVLLVLGDVSKLLMVAACSGHVKIHPPPSLGFWSLLTLALLTGYFFLKQSPSRVSHNLKLFLSGGIRKCPYKLQKIIDNI
ncbi:hypothetical protein BDR26DRAFT_857685 [Obelidium mucronatum]|nr:hypothetical protein BDR26DRAFT_857685 [Obelidium mucronatum]